VTMTLAHTFLFRFGLVRNSRHRIKAVLDLLRALFRKGRG
jgi:hypothetical protein